MIRSPIPTRSDGLSTPLFIRWQWNFTANAQVVNVTPPFRQRGDCHRHPAPQQHYELGGGLISHGLLSHGDVLRARVCQVAHRGGRRARTLHTSVSSSGCSPRRKPRRPEQSGLLHKHLTSRPGPWGLKAFQRAPSLTKRSEVSTGSRESLQGGLLRVSRGSRGPASPLGIPRQ